MWSTVFLIIVANIHGHRWAFSDNFPTIYRQFPDDFQTIFQLNSDNIQTLSRQLELDKGRRDHGKELIAPPARQQQQQQQQTNREIIGLAVFREFEVDNMVAMI